MADPPILFDRTLHRRRLDRAAEGFSAAGFIWDNYLTRWQS